MLLCTKSGAVYNTAVVIHNKMCYLEVICHHNKKFQAGGLDFEIVSRSQMFLQKTVEEVLKNNERNAIEDLRKGHTCYTEAKYLATLLHKEMRKRECVIDSWIWLGNGRPNIKKMGVRFFELTMLK